MKNKNQARFNRHCIIYTIVAVLLLPLLLFVFTGCTAQADTEFTLPDRTLPENAERLSYSYFRYKVYDDKTVVITEYKGEGPTVVIPDVIDGMPVVELSDELFYQNQKIESVVLGKNIERIGTNCFCGCSFLQNVTLNKKVWSIGAYAFSGTPWLNSLSDEFVVVGDGVLLKYNGNDVGIEIPNTVRHISDAFTLKALVSVTMSDSVLTIGEFAFAFNSLLCNIEFSKSLLMVDKYAFIGCDALSSVILPDRVERVGSNAFSECVGLNTVHLSASLTDLGEYAFYGCSEMRAVYLPSSVSMLPVGAFEECKALELVLYGGDEKSFKSIVSDTTNYLLLDATIVYNAKSGE